MGEEMKKILAKVRVAMIKYYGPPGKLYRTAANNAISIRKTKTWCVFKEAFVFRKSDEGWVYQDILDIYATWIVVWLEQEVEGFRNYDAKLVSEIWREFVKDGNRNLIQNVPEKHTFYGENPDDFYHGHKTMKLRAYNVAAFKLLATPAGCQRAKEPTHLVGHGEALA